MALTKIDELGSLISLRNLHLKLCIECQEEHVFYNLVNEVDNANVDKWLSSCLGLHNDWSSLVYSVLVVIHY